MAAGLRHGPAPVSALSRAAQPGGPRARHARDKPADEEPCEVRREGQQQVVEAGALMDGL